jgi:lipoprotein NlpD
VGGALQQSINSIMNKRCFFLLAGLLVPVWLAGCAATATPTSVTGVTKPVDSQVQHERDYRVRSGDTLTAIGKRFGVSSLQLQYRNNLSDPHALSIGQRLVIPAGSLKVPDTFSDGARFIWPLQRFDVSSEFGSRNNRHKGIDLRAPRGTPIRAAADGVVHFAGRQRGYGKVIIIKHAGDIQTFYAHNDKNLVKKGQRVQQGDVIGTVGKTGNATGYHVHFEFIRGRLPLNPRHYISG